MRRKLAAGNWKMHGLALSLNEAEALAAQHGDATCEILLCPPATLIARMAAVLERTNVAVGGQDCHAAAAGAHTGDIAAEMIGDAGGTYVIVGHSERRTDHGETDADVAAKASPVWRAGLTAIVCVGETLEEREAGRTLDVIGTQLAGSIPDGATAANLVVAYEPVWAIGTGHVPTLEQIGEVHDAIRSALTTRFDAETADGIRLLYGGSVKPGNAAEIFAVPNVDGALVGGASLKAEDFGGIVAALDAAAS